MDSSLLIGLGAVAAVALAMLAARSFSRGRRRSGKEDGGHAFVGTSDTASCDTSDGGASCGDGGGGGD